MLCHLHFPFPQALPGATDFLTSSQPPSFASWAQHSDIEQVARQDRLARCVELPESETDTFHRSASVILSEAKDLGGIDCAEIPSASSGQALRFAQDDTGSRVCPQQRKR